jgi:signal transduction histidine kinase
MITYSWSPGIRIYESSIRTTLDALTKLEETNNMLRKANEQKTQFFINVAHETKTPLTLIRNYLERSMEHFASDPDLAVVKQNIDILREKHAQFSRHGMPRKRHDVVFS